MAGNEATEEMAVDLGDIPASPPLSLPVTQIINTAQAQHGLRHSDFARYRQYCTRKLHRLHKALKMTHGRGKYVPRKLEAKSVTEVGHLMLPLVNAERSWSRAMELKAELEKEAVSYKRQHMIRRLSKAAHSAEELSELASQRGDARTALEAQAYALYMAGTLAFERQRWEAALAKLLRAQNVYQQLSKLGSLELQAVLNKMLDEVATPIKFCQYKLHGPSGADTGLKVPDSPSGKLIQARLQSLEEQQDVEVSASSAGVGAIAWRGQTNVVSAERVRVALGQALELSKQVDKAETSQRSVEERAEIFAKMIAAFNEAKGSIRQSLTAGKSGEQAAGSQEELKLLDVTVTGTQLERVIQRGKALAADARQRYESGTQEEPATAQPLKKRKKSKLDKSGPPKAEGVVRAYDSLIGHVKELSEVATRLGGPAGETLLEECTAQAATFAALRCFYVARSYLAASKAVEAMGLFQRTTERVAQAEQAWDDLEDPDAQALKDLQALKEQAVAWRCVAHAESIAQNKLAEQRAQEGMGDLGLETKHKAVYLLDNLDSWESYAGSESQPARIYPVPPPLQSLAVRPFMLDSALSFVQPPSLEHRVKKEEAKSTFSRIFTWGGKK
ncbi:g2733 [Coccomyxa viridis]|uniref:Signal recognition particle subunit SRP68 n=1 Tax=Coccomyxa viridis TaxID=1274662 RepID=A0ABP1FPS0_9CHLO